MNEGAELLRRRAVEQANRGRYAAAWRLLAQAQTRTSDRGVLARVRGTEAVILANHGEFTAAFDAANAALATEGLDTETVGMLLGQLGTVASLAGRPEEAETYLSSALDQVSEPGQRAILLANRSVLRMGLRRLDEAAQDAAAAVEAHNQSGNTTLGAQTRHNLGYLHLLRGDLVRALEEMRAARPLAASSPVATAICDTDRAEVLRDAGLTSEAEALLASSAPVFGRHRMPQSRADTELQLARSQLMHDPAKAKKTASAAARRFRSVGNEAWAARADAIRLRAALSAGASTAGASGAKPRRTVDPAEAEAVASTLTAHGFASEAAGLRLSLDIWRSRHPLGHSAPPPLVRVPGTASLEVRLLAHEARAHRAAASGRESAVRRHVSAGLDELAEWQGAFGSLDLQTSVSAHGRSLIVTGLASAVRSRRPDVLFEWSERARHLSQQVVAIRPPQDSELAADLAELRRLRADDPTGAWRRDPRLLALEERARERQWSATGAAGIHQRITLEGLRDVLDDRTALLTFIYSGAALTALVVTRDKARVIDLPGWDAARKAFSGFRADLDMSASIRTGPMADVVKRSLDDRLAVISDALLADAVAFADVERFVITLPGELEGLPWAMMPALKGRVFTLAASATRWASVTGTSRFPKTAGFAVGPRVLRGDEEVDAAASAWPDARILRGPKATVDAVAELAPEVDLLHVAAHGRHAADNALFSGFELADGTLFGYDVDRIAQVPTIVVLSSCEVGRSSVRWGEEAVGMARVWLHAGTRAVVATPVIVADDIACELLGAMHQGLAEGRGPSAALADASARTGLVSSFQVHGAGF
ncbi:CHAT domain-containing protein [Microbacterium sp. ASV49]|uniref:CHAT domain-containing protein n=1 Tax=Microbacterium candidum TaxID=3041922 RepID=A0ABT7MVP0_9MICO|nr:CHAT domain-containing protein [Microbacterium sp. ASV49]MDL9978512.1 CHAT domain-containing protein [Microbacterium sp. ASV49]